MYNGFQQSAQKQNMWLIDKYLNACIIDKNKKKHICGFFSKAEPTILLK